MTASQHAQYQKWHKMSKCLWKRHIQDHQTILEKSYPIEVYHSQSHKKLLCYIRQFRYYVNSLLTNSNFLMESHHTNNRNWKGKVHLCSAPWCHLAVEKHHHHHHHRHHPWSCCDLWILSSSLLASRWCRNWRLLVKQKNMWCALGIVKETHTHIVLIVLKCI